MADLWAATIPWDSERCARRAIRLIVLHKQVIIGAAHTRSRVQKEIARLEIHVRKVQRSCQHRKALDEHRQGEHRRRHSQPATVPGVNAGGRDIATGD